MTVGYFFFFSRRAFELDELFARLMVMENQYYKSEQLCMDNFEVYIYVYIHFTELISFEIYIDTYSIETDVANVGLLQ